MNCTNCGEPHGTADVFCEKCGLDFLSGSLPAPVEPAVAPASPDAEPSEPPSPTSEALDDAAPNNEFVLRVIIEADAAFHALMVPDGEVPLPDPLPQTTLELRGTELLVGRASQSRGVFPEIDVQAASGDPAVSTRHAVLRRGDDGSWTVRDLDSTNGTYVQEPDQQIAAGVAVPVQNGTAIFVGAYTKLTVELP